MEDPATTAERTLHVGDAAKLPPEAAAAAPGGERKPNVPYMINPTTAGVLDERGRFLEVRKLHAMDRLDLAVLLGAENVKNPVVQGYCALAFSISKIDGEAIFPPAQYNELRGLVGRLGDEGLNAVGEAAEMLNPEAAKPVDVDAVKNS